MKLIKKIIMLIILTVMLLGSPLLARLITNLFDFSNLDPDRAFLWISVRHILQALIVFLFMIIITRFTPIDFHLGIGEKEVGLKYLKRFMIIFSIYTVITFTIILITKQFDPFPFPMVSRNILGYMGFQLLLSGPSEEFIFRAFAMSMFAYFISKKQIDKRISFANLYAAIIFGLAHIAISFSPFGLSYALPQVLLATGLGFFYGYCYEKSKSVIYPMIMHSFTNVLMVGITIILTIILGS